MELLAFILFPRSDPKRCRHLKVLAGALAVGLLTAAVLGLGLYYFNDPGLGGR